MAFSWPVWVVRAQLGSRERLRQGAEGCDTVAAGWQQLGLEAPAGFPRLLC